MNRKDAVNKIRNRHGYRGERKKGGENKKKKRQSKKKENEKEGEKSARDKK